MTPGVNFVVKVTISMVNVIATSITISIVIVIIMIIISLEIDIVSLLKISGIDGRPETELQLRRN